LLIVLIVTVLEEDGVSITVLPRKEVIRRLRDRNEPILLFGETELAAFKRLRKLEISEPEINRVRCVQFPKYEHLFNGKLF
jgi:pre-mRNA processing factor 4 (PRP4) like